MQIPEYGLRFSMSNKPQGDVDAAGPRTTFGVMRI